MSHFKHPSENTLGEAAREVPAGAASPPWAESPLSHRYGGEINAVDLHWYAEWRTSPQNGKT